MLEKSELSFIDISEIELNNVFLHYTNINNLTSIAQKGLVPKIGKNSKVLEKTKKIFFSVGDKGALVIMDSWLKWLVGKPINNTVYYIGAFLLKVPFFPKFIHKLIVKVNKNKWKYKWSYKKLKSILDNSVYLILNLEETIDFDFNDVDEIKFSKYPRWFIKDFYSNNSDVTDAKMEYWNMHTFSNKIVDPQKIYLLKMDNEINAGQILKYLIENNFEYVKQNCKLLNKYYEYIYLKK
ncbi:MAG: hypothetical protein E7161_05115 [Firmicutes bacterium]|nr:hypothetical protein [Bacillota bacterium]